MLLHLQDTCALQPYSAAGVTYSIPGAALLQPGPGESSWTTATSSYHRSHWSLGILYMWTCMRYPTAAADLLNVQGSASHGEEVNAWCTVITPPTEHGQQGSEVRARHANVTVRVLPLLGTLSLWMCTLYPRAAARLPGAGGSAVENARRSMSASSSKRTPPPLRLHWTPFQDCSETVVGN